MIRKLSLRARLLLGNITLLALALLVTVGIARALISWAMLAALDRTLEKQAQGMANPEMVLPHRDDRHDRERQPNDSSSRPNDVPPPNDMPPPNDPPPNDRRFREHPRFPFPASDGVGTLRRPRVVSFVDPHSHAPWREPWSTMGIDKARGGQADWLTEQQSGDRVRIFTLPIVQNGKIIGMVQTAASLMETENALAVVTYSLALLLPVALGLAALGGTLLTRSALTPVQNIAQAAARLSHTNLAERLPEPSGTDEFATLIRMLNGMLARIEAGFQRERRFTAAASHELRTPLAVIKTATTMLRGDDTLPSALRKEALASIDEASDRANRLISDLLFLARAENGALPVRLSTVNISSMIEAAVRDAQTAHGETENAASITLQIADPSITLVTDGDLLRRLLVNLLSNALRYTPSGGTITVDAIPGSAHLSITVTDTGMGIAPEYLARLGEPFYRPDVARSRADGGAGLGLSICKAIVDALGGSLQINSKPDVGTTAAIYLWDK